MKEFAADIVSYFIQLSSCRYLAVNVTVELNWALVSECVFAYSLLILYRESQTSSP